MSVGSIRRRSAIALIGLWVIVFMQPMASAAPSGSTALDRFLDGLESWQADFTQTITDSRGRAKTGDRGRLVVQRPGKFRWEIGTSQLMVADGRNLWFHDLELDQITVKPANRALSATPATLLAGTAPLRDQFSVVQRGMRGGLEWVAVKPKSAAAEFREARLAFAGRDLRRMELTDALGQQVVLEFSATRRNAPVVADALRFVPPPGADLIGTPIE